MDSADYCAYLGITYGRRPTKSLAVQQWNCVFDGTKDQVNQFIAEHPAVPPLQYIIAPSNYEPSQTISRPVMHYDRIKKIEKIIDHGMHVCVHTFHRSYWHFKIEFAGGDEGFMTHSGSEASCREGDKVMYTKRIIDNKTIIQIKTIFGL